MNGFQYQKHILHTTLDVSKQIQSEKYEKVISDSLIYILKAKLFEI